MSEGLPASTAQVGPDGFDDATMSVVRAMAATEADLQRNGWSAELQGNPRMDQLQVPPAPARARGARGCAGHGPPLGTVGCGG